MVGLEVGAGSGKMEQDALGGQKAEGLCPGSVDMPRGSELEVGAGEAGLDVFCCLHISQNFTCLVSH